jgi:hypothetical protein
MKRWRIYCPFVCRIVIEQTRYHAMPQFDGMTEEEVIEAVRRNILHKWPTAHLRSASHWGKPAIDVSRDGNFYCNEPETPPFLHSVALGYRLSKPR